MNEPLLRILFVEAQETVQKSIRKILTDDLPEWELTFADQAREALVLLGKSEFDVVVASLDLPDSDGITLLKEIQSTYPQTLRVITADEESTEATLRAASIAHQCIAKPFKEDPLRQTLERLWQTKGFLTTQEVIERVNALGALPVAPKIYYELEEVLAAGNVEVEVVSKVIEKNLVVYAKLLQMVNSSFMGLAQEIRNMSDAVMYLGFDTIKNVVFSAEIFEQFASEAAPNGFSVEELQTHSSDVAALARLILEDSPQADQAFMAGMLHDIGKWVLGVRQPSAVAKANLLATRSDSPIDRLERITAGISHPDIGAYLLGSWGLPFPIVDAVRFHHLPSASGSTEFGALGAVHVANALLNWVTSDSGDHRIGLDFKYLEKCQVQDQIQKWKQLATQMPGS